MKLLSTKEAAIKLGVSDRRIRAMIKAGTIKAQLIAGGYVIEEKEINNVKTYSKPGRPSKAKDAERPVEPQTTDGE